MDELLALMESSPAEKDSSSTSQTEESGMDELASLLCENPPQESSKPPGPHPYSTNSALVTPSHPQRRAPSKPVEVSVDDRLGIRMINRTMSSIDLIDLISVNPYQSPASLSAMSLASLARILVDPPRIVDRATVCGRTNVVTVGIVFSNSGTRISAKGGAFCVLTIGSFVSGPCVSILLFGDVYSKHCRACQPGKVIALVGPRLLPPKNGSNDTSISFSVTDPSQLQIVAMAKDYGICKASTRVKQPDGQWTASGNCKNYVDKRKCEYCDVHRKQKYQTSTSNMRVGGSIITNKKGNTFMQKMRSERVPLQNRNRNLMVNNTNGRTNNRLLNPSLNSGMNRQDARNDTQLTNRTERDIPTRNGRPIPMHMKKEAAKSQNTSNGLLNGTLKPATKPKKLGIVGTGDWINNSTKRPVSALVSHTKKKQRAVNTAGGGFNGSVPVPKPSRIFQSRTPKVIARTTTSTVQAEIAKDKIIEAQSKLAQKLKEKAVALNGRKASSSGAKSVQVKRPQDGKSFLDALGDIDEDAVLKAKSKFAKEADAEHYARSRRIVTELEQQEALREKKENKKENAKKNRMNKEWVCRTCGGVKFKSKPNNCVRAGHNVKLVRQINSTLSKTEERTKLHDRNIDDGGLRLGAGLEWSRPYSRFS